MQSVLLTAIENNDFELNFEKELHQAAPTACEVGSS